MRHVYVAGSYTAENAAGVEANVTAAIDATVELLDAGLHPYTPHLSHYVHARHPRGYETWMALDFAWVKRCDALLRLPGKSSGADREVALAREIGIPVFHSVRDVLVWAEVVPPPVPFAPTDCSDGT